MKRLAVFLSLLLMVGIHLKSVSAIEAEQVSFSVSAVLTENQINDRASYFDIEMTKGQKQVLEVIITNGATEPIEVAVSSNSAATNSNGVVIYDGSQTDHQVNMEYPLSEITEVSEEVVTVPAESQASVYFTVQAPEESFDGRILGGLHFQLLSNEDEEVEGVSIQNQYAYVIGVNIVEKGNETVVTPELDFVSAQIEEINYRLGLQTVFENPTPVLISRLIFEGQIYPEDSGDELLSRKVESFSIAPNNRFNFPITFDQGRLEPGNYVFKANVYNDDYKWEFEEPFTVEEENN